MFRVSDLALNWWHLLPSTKTQDLVLAPAWILLLGLVSPFETQACLTVFYILYRLFVGILIRNLLAFGSRC